MKPNAPSLPNSTAGEGESPNPTLDRNSQAPFDPAAYRHALGSFLTGVTVVAARDAEGAPRGFTANSFTSVSLDPPLILVCIGDHAHSYDVFASCESFAVSVLAAAQRETSNLFASKAPDKFEQADWREGVAGAPIIDDALGWFDCTIHDRVIAGDHLILIGRVEAFGEGEAAPLGFHRGGYVALSDAADARRGGDALRVGAIVEQQGAVLLVEEDGQLSLPSADRLGRDGEDDPGSLIGLLAALGAATALGPLFSAYEQAGIQHLFYRCEAPQEATGRFIAFDQIDWDRITDPAERSMLKRYAGERESLGFGIYLGGAEQGEIHHSRPGEENGRKA